MPSTTSSSSLASLLVEFTSGSDTPAAAQRPVKAQQHGKAMESVPPYSAAGRRGSSPAPLGPGSAGKLVRAKDLHTSPCEEGGLTMIELTEAMKKDARAQEHLTVVIADMLEDTIARNDAKNRKGELASFEGEKAPISPSAYVKRIVKYGGCSPCCFAVGILYLERLKRRHNRLCLTSRNFQRLFLVAVMEAAKYLDDFYYSNKHWAEVGGISTRELNALELELLFRLNFNLSVRREDYDSFVSQLIGDEPEGVMHIDENAAKLMVEVSSVPVDEHWRVGEKAGEHSGMGGKKTSYVNVTDAARNFKIRQTEREEEKDENEALQKAQSMQI